MHRQRTMSESDNNSSQSDAASILLSTELGRLCASDDFSEENLCQIIQRHKLSTPNNHHQVSDYQFFHEACRNRKITEGMIRCLIEYFPAAANSVGDGRLLPLHFACQNSNVSLGIIRLLIDAAPDSVRRANDNGQLPLHYICEVKDMDESAAIDILKLLLEKHPESIRHEDIGSLPIHIAAMASKSPEFCRLLIEAYPESERIGAGPLNILPIHYACFKNTVETVEYLYNLYPDVINHAITLGMYPIHDAISGVTQREAPGAALDICPIQQEVGSID